MQKEHPALQIVQQPRMLSSNLTPQSGLLPTRTQGMHKEQLQRPLLVHNPAKSDS